MFVDPDIQPLSSADPAPIDWAIRPVLGKGELLYLVGHGGQGKSTLIADIVASVAYNFFKTRSPADVVKLVESDYPNPWPGGLCAGGTLRTDPDLSPVLIVDGENTRRVWKRLLSKTLATYGISPQSKLATTISEQIFHVRSEEFQLASKTNRRACNKALFEAVQRQQFRLLILDPIWKIYSATEPADPSWVTDGISYLRDLCLDSGVTMIAVAHPAADSEGRNQARRVQPFGSSQQHGMYDALLYLKRTGQKSVLSLHKTRAQDWIAPGAKVHLEFGPRGGGFLPCRDPWPLEEPADNIYLTDPAYKILASLPWDAPFKLADIPGITRKTASLHVKGELVASGVVEHVSGEGKRGDPEVFKVTDMGRKFLKFKGAEKSP